MLLCITYYTRLVVVSLRKISDIGDYPLTFCWIGSYWEHQWQLEVMLSTLESCMLTADDIELVCTGQCAL